MYRSVEVYIHINLTTFQKTPMKRKNLLLLLLVAFMTFGTGVLLSSCSDNDDSNSSQPAETDNYEIEVEPGLTMNENQFQTRVPATTD